MHWSLSEQAAKADKDKKKMKRYWGLNVPHGYVLDNHHDHDHHHDDDDNDNGNDGGDSGDSGGDGGGDGGGGGE